MAQWKIDSDHTVAAFTARHFMIADVHGQFNKITGNICFDPTNVASSSVEVVIDAACVYTGVPKRDDHLRSADFLDVANHPTIAFRGSNVEPLDAQRFKVNGDLTIRGTTRPVTFKATFAGPVKSPYDEDRSIGFSAATVINRDDFGITYNDAIAGGVIISRELRITLDVEADLLV